MDTTTRNPTPPSSAPQGATHVAPDHETKMDLVGDREVVISRIFRARPAIVFDAWTRPELVARWWAPRGLEAQGEQTRLLSHEAYPSPGARDAAIAAGMESGMRETMEQLDAPVASLSPG